MRRISKFLYILMLWLMIFPLQVCASEQDFTLHVRSVALADLLHVVAKLTPYDVVISPGVQGQVSLDLQHVVATDALAFLVNTHGLAQTKRNGILYLQSRDELAADKLADARMQEAVSVTDALETHIWQIRYAKVEDLAHLILQGNASLLSKRGVLRVDPRTNTLLLKEIPAQVRLVRQLIDKIDVPVQQILIEARLASVDSDYLQELGIQFATQEASDESATFGAGNGAKFSLAVARLADKSLLDVTLSALEKNGKGELISHPSLFTANQQTATIEAGEEIPYQEISRSGATGVAFKKAVLSLKVTPQVMPGNQVLLQLQVNQDKTSNRMVLGVPAISTRQITTHILIKNGHTLVLGGIYEHNHEDGIQRIPFISKIPLVGWLFQQHNVIDRKRELLIFVTPKIITS